MVVEIFSFRNVEEIRIILYPRGKIILVARKCRNFCHYWSYVNKEKDKENKKKKRKISLFYFRVDLEERCQCIVSLDEKKRRGTEISIRKKKKKRVAFDVHKAEKKERRRGEGYSRRISI